MIAARSLTQRAHGNDNRVPLGPTGTRTRTDAPGAERGRRQSMRARTIALRVVGSTRASTATIRAAIGVGIVVAMT